MNRPGFAGMIVAGVLSWVSLGAAPAAGEDWPQQGGAERTAVVPSRPLKLETLTPSSHAAPCAAFAVNAGFGIAQPVCVAGKLYTYGFYPPGTTAETIVKPATSITCADAFSNPRKLEELSDDKLPDAPPYASHFNGPRGEEWAVCWDAATGKLAWATRLTDQAFVYRSNNIVSDEAAPLFYRGKLYVHVISGHLYCLDAASGKLAWDRTLYDAHMYQWTMKQGNACGPVAVGDTVVVSFNGMRDPNYAKFSDGCLAAAGFDARTGETLWTTAVPLSALRPNNARLALTTIDGKPQILAPGGKGTAGLDPATGNVLWSYEVPGPVPFPWTGYAPAVWQDRGETYVFDAVDAAHDDKESQSWGLRIRGDKAEVLWATHDFKPYSMIQKSNVVVRDGKVLGFDSRSYGNDDGKRDKNLPPGRGVRPEGQGRFQCRDIRTGKLLWSTDAFGPTGVATPTYLLLAGDTLFVTHATGLYVGALGGEGIKQVAHVPFRGSGDMAEPVLAGTRLYLRQQDLTKNEVAPDTPGNLFCFDLTP